MAESKIPYIPLDGLKFIRCHAAGTTASDGTLTIANPAGASYVYLLRNTYDDNVVSSFGVINIEYVDVSSIKLRFRTLKDGSANANANVSVTLILAYQ